MLFKILRTEEGKKIAGDAAANCEAPTECPLCKAQKPKTEVEVNINGHIIFQLCAEVGKTFFLRRNKKCGYIFRMDEEFWN